jgi:RNA polymerase sigma-70 factor (ECF subfamily)
METQANAREAFQDLAKSQLPVLFSMARRLAGDRGEDLVQETLMRAFRSFDQLSDPQAGPRWIQTILINVYRDIVRKNQRSVREVSLEEIDDFSLYRTIAEEDPFPYSDTLHHDFLHSFGAEDIRAVLLRLPDLYRVPLVLRYVEGFATKEVARMLEVPLGTALARLHRGRKLFEKEMWSYAQEARLLERESVS